MDSSFLEAIPEDIREELRQDFDRQKQAAATAAASTSSGPLGSTNKHHRPQKIGMFLVFLWSTSIVNNVFHVLFI